MHAPHQSAPAPGTTAAPLARAVWAIQGNAGLDAPVRRVRALVDRALPSPELRATLRGEQLGHALHPLMTDLPIGAWTSTTLLDVFGGKRSRRAATGLLAFGCAAALPTAVTGWAEWREADEPAQRVGLVHAVSNVIALALFTSSLRHRLRGRHARGVLVALLAAAVASVGGYLGGHLSIAMKVGTVDPAIVPPAAHDEIVVPPPTELMDFSD